MKPKFEAFRLTADLFDPAREINLENLYNLCTAELTLQQTKRDQIIAFYVAKGHRDDLIAAVWVEACRFGIEYDNLAEVVARQGLAQVFECHLSHSLQTKNASRMAGRNKRLHQSP